MRGTPLPGRAAGAVAWPCRFKPASPTCCLVVLETVTQAGRQWRLWENLAWERKGGGREGGSGAGWGPGQEAPSTSQAGAPSSLEHPFVRCVPPHPFPWTPLWQTRPPSAVGANNPLGCTPAGGGHVKVTLPPCPCVPDPLSPHVCHPHPAKLWGGHWGRGRCRERGWMCPPPGMGLVPPGMVFVSPKCHPRPSVLSYGVGGMPASHLFSGSSFLLGSVAS